MYFATILEIYESIQCLCRNAPNRCYGLILLLLGDSVILHRNIGISLESLARGAGMDACMKKLYGCGCPSQFLLVKHALLALLGYSFKETAIIHAPNLLL